MTIDWRLDAKAPEEVVALVQNGMRVFIHGASATPAPLLDALSMQTSLREVELVHMHLEGGSPFVAAECAGRLRSNSLFAGPGVRAAIAEGQADFTPVFLSDIPRLFESGVLPLDVAMLQLSPPDAHGYCTLGTSVDVAMSAARNARVVIAEINERMPRTHGNTLIPLASLDAYCRSNRPLPPHPRTVPDEVEEAIGRHVANLIPDGATLQMGIGAIPDAVLSLLGDKNDLGVHTEMFSDQVVDLVRRGVITNARKKVHPGRITTSFVLGSEVVLEFVDDNPFVEFYPADHTNDPGVIRKNDSVVAINSAIEVDLTGQVVADSIGHRIYSGIGGQMDFMRGAALSRGGIPIIALRSTASGGKVSRIVCTLKPGAGVVTTRGHVHWVVTEYGAVNLWGKTLRQRAELLISIAHPAMRSQLMAEVREIRHFFPQS